jgi:N-carbamoyl-L-amino-acid hydrolase
VLERRGIPTGVVTAIRGASRARGIRCVGEYTHSGAVPHEYRSDAVLASVELIHELDRLWERMRGEGADLVFTVGKLYTDPAVHSLTKVPGETNFTIDFRSQDEATLARVTAEARKLALEIGERRRVQFDLGKFSLHRPALMDPRLRAELIQGCRDLAIPMMEIASGAGHDAQDFAAAGVPSAMIFVRNAHGSHNPKEAMDIADFALGTEMLGWLLLSEPG